MKKKIYIGLIAAAVLFLIIFAGRFIYLVYQDKPVSSIRGQRMVNNEYSQNAETQSIRNYASKKISNDLGAPSGGQKPVAEQKYEKNASLTARTGRFDEDEKKLRASLTASGSIVQYENKSGLTGARSLYMTIGIRPEQFDKTVEELKTIGRMESFQVTLIDKTSEYKNLNSERLSLEKMRAALIGLKSTGGTLSDRIELENKILEVEKKLQDLSVNLGVFSAENEFSTAYFSLIESKDLNVQKNWGSILVSSLLWAFGVYAALAGVLLLTLLGLWLLIKLIEKFNWVPGILKQYWK